jgi:hypothetical protein
MTSFLLTTVSWSGTRDIFGPENLLDKDVVLVTLNYRDPVMLLVVFSTPLF